MQSRTRLDPVLVPGVDVHDQRTGGGRGRHAAEVASVGLAGERIGERAIGEREYPLRIVVLLACTLRHPGLFEAEIQGDAVAGTDPIEHSVEYLLTVQVLVEAEPDEVVHRA